MPESSVNPDLEREIRSQPAFRIMLLDQATVAKGFATAFDKQVSGPWMPRRRQPIEVVQEHGDTLLVNTDYAGHLIEFGSRNNPPHAVLRRAVRAAGLKLAEASKA